MKNKVPKNLALRLSIQQSRFLMSIIYMMVLIVIESALMLLILIFIKFNTSILFSILYFIFALGAFLTLYFIVLKFFGKLEDQLNEIKEALK